MDPTKRNIVSIIGRFYDPLGFLAPVIISFKILLQGLCGQKLDWDQPLPTALLDKWKSLIGDMQGCNSVSIPRSYHHSIKGESVVSYTLCGFCDASVAYAAVVYLVVKTCTGIYVRFVTSKSRVAPMQPTTIPRLELLSAVLLTRLITTIATILHSVISHPTLKCYSDSQVAIYWIKGVNKEWKQFVQNRVSEIRQKTHPDIWNTAREKLTLQTYLPGE